MENAQILSITPGTETDFLIEVVVYEECLQVLDSRFAETEKFHCLIEEEKELFQQMKILSEGIKRGEKQFSFEFFSKKHKRWFRMKACYTERLVDIKYPVFELVIADITHKKNPVNDGKDEQYEKVELVERIHCGVIKIKLDEGNTIEWANEYFKTHIGAYKQLQECVAPRDGRKIKELLEQEETFNTYSKKVQMQCIDGGFRWFDVRIEQTNKKENETSVYCVLSDITDEVLQERKLKMFQKRYKTVLSITSELVFEYDIRNDTMYYFGHGEKTLHRPECVENFGEYILGEGLDGERLTPESRAIIQTAQERIKQNWDSLKEAHIAYEYPDGRKQWIYIVGKYVLDDQGKIDRVIGKLSDVTDQKQTEETLLRKARMDALTNIDNRDCAKEEINQYVANHASGYKPSLLILDIDNFKGIYDSYGHEEGNRVRVHVAGILIKEFRSTDIIASLGEEKFIVFMKDITSSENVYEKANRVLKQIQQEIQWVSVSIGISILEEDEATFDILYDTAEQALYQAKAKGKNQFICYQEMGELRPLQGRYKLAPPQEQTGFVSQGILEQLIDRYDWVYRVNLEEDTVQYWIPKSQEGIHITSYRVMYDKLQEGMPTKEEKEAFERKFHPQNLEKQFNSLSHKQTHYVRMQEQDGKQNWYLVESFVPDPNKNEEGILFLVKDVQEENIKRIQTLEEQESEQGDISYDGLTGLYQERKFYEEAKRKLCEDEQKQYAIISFDVDNFRVLNDIYGESIGNKILCYLGEVLRDMEIEDKLYSRYWADRFTVFMSYKERADILLAIDEIREKCSVLPWISGELKLSFGVYQIANRRVPLRLMCDWARLAEETVKGLSMQYYAFYNEEYRTQLVERQLIEDEMNKALEEGQFLMYLQPKYSLETNQVIGAEALVRWKHPTKGMIPPDKFIPLFEKNGFIIKLDEFIWEEACKKIKKWMDMGIEVPISVNISRMHTYDTGFVEKLVNMVERYKIPVHLLQLEFTESMIVEHEQALVSLMYRLKEHGFTLLMDDFGSGYSSLNMLKNVPIDIIKLDRIFFEDIMVNTRGKVIIEASIRMIHQLDLDVTAEGIENKEHIEFLNKCHCNTGQGYFYAKPMDVQEFELNCVNI